MDGTAVGSVTLTTGPPGSRTRPLRAGRSPNETQYNLRRSRSREEVAMQDSTRMGGSLGKTVLLVILLALLCAACDRSADESKKGGNDIAPITTEEEPITTEESTSTEEPTSMGPGKKEENAADTGKIPVR